MKKIAIEELQETIRNLTGATSAMSALQRTLVSQRSLVESALVRTETLRVSDLLVATRHASILSDQLRIARSPFPQLASFATSAIAAHTASMSASIDDAELAVEIEVEAEEDEELTSETVQRGLDGDPDVISVIGPDAMQHLHQVDYAPFVILDRILRDPAAMHHLRAAEFPAFVASLVDRLGFEDVVFNPSANQGDPAVMAVKRMHGLKLLFAFECQKRSPEHLVGPEVLRALLGTIAHADSRATSGVLVTTSTFTPAARKFILTEPRIAGRDFEGLTEWLLECGTPRLYSFPRQGDTPQVSRQSQHQGPLRVLLASVHQEDGWLSRLRAHLRPLERQGRISVWDHTAVVPGADVQRERQAALIAADVAVLLMSADFFANDTTASVILPYLLESAASERVRLLPLYVQSCRLADGDDLSRYQAVNLREAPLAALTSAEAEVVLTRIVDTISSCRAGTQ